MPTHTPSPHRFLAPNPPSTQNPKPKPPSSLRHGFPVRTPKSAISTRQAQVRRAETPKVTPAKRFVIAPMRGGTSTQRQDEGWPHAQTQDTPRANPARKLKRVESIEEGSQGSRSDSPTTEYKEGGLAPSIEHAALFAEDEEEGEDSDENADILFAPPDTKRRRISPPAPVSPSHTRAFVSSLMHAPQTPASAMGPASSHRFLAPAPRTPALPIISTSTLASAPSRPHFLLPPQQLSPPRSATPLPETFSPSRKGQRYVPGGLASTLQGWIIETANTGYAAQNREAVVWGREKEDGVKMKVKVSCIRSGGTTTMEGEVECFPGGVVFVAGVTEVGLYNASRAPSIAREEGEVRVLLAGQGGARGAGGVRIRVGTIVGIRAPMWDVDVGEEKWIVGVDWVVL